MKGLQIAHYATFGIIAIEFIACAQAYWMFRQMNTSQDYRERTHKNFPWALDKFYSLAEYVHGNADIKKGDYEKWGLSVEEGK